MDSSTESLLCEENLQIDSPWSKDLNTHCIDYSDSTPYHDFPYYTGHVGSCSTLPFAVPEDYEEAIKICLEKESAFMPSAGYYLQHLRASELCDARRRAVFWMNKVGRHFNFKALIISSAVNHMDRFLWKNRHDQTWKSWMMELVSMGCLSIAAKMDEVNVPRILDFQVEGIDHVFESYTLQRMELSIMKALGWRMNAVTPFSYTEAMAQHLRFDCIVRTSIVSRVTELLLGSLFEEEFVEFRPSIVALAAMFCALEELVPLQAEPHITELSRFLNAEKVDLQKCYRFMEERIVDPLPPSVSSNRLNGKPKFPTSPVTVIQKVPENRNNGIILKCSLQESSTQFHLPSSSNSKVPENRNNGVMLKCSLQESSTQFHLPSNSNSRLHEKRKKSPTTRDNKYRKKGSCVNSHQL